MCWKAKLPSLVEGSAKLFQYVRLAILEILSVVLPFEIRKALGTCCVYLPTDAISFLH